jgi:leucyl-tRNA synthetase
MMIWVNHFTKNENSRSLVCLKPFVQILNPFAPHLAEELWEKMGCKELLSLAEWPSFDPALAKSSSITVAVQVSGKTRGTIEIEEGQSQEDVEKKAKEASFVQYQLAGKTIEKVIYVPNKIINFVVR